MEATIAEASLVPEGTDLLAEGRGRPAEDPARAQAAVAPEPASPTLQPAQAVAEADFAGADSPKEGPAADWTGDKVEVVLESGVHLWADILRKAGHLGTNPRVGYADLLGSEGAAKTDIKGNNARALRQRFIAARKGGISLAAVPPFVLLDPDPGAPSSTGAQARAVQSILDEFEKVEEARAAGSSHPRLGGPPRASSRAASARARSPRRRSRSTARRSSRERSGYGSGRVGGAAALPRTASREPGPSIEEIGVDRGGPGDTTRSQRPVPPVTSPVTWKEQRLYWWDAARYRWTQTRVIRDRGEAEEAREIGWTGDLLDCEVAAWGSSGGIRLVANTSARPSQSTYGGSDFRECRCHEQERYSGGLPLPPLNQYNNCSGCGLKRWQEEIPAPQGSAKVTFEQPPSSAPKPSRRSGSADSRPSGSSSSAARPEEAILADCERAIGENDGENLVISREQLRDIVHLLKGHSASSTEFPVLAGHQGRAAEASFKEVAAKAAACAAIPRPIVESDEVFATPVRVIVDLFDTFLFENRDGPYIPHSHADPLRRLLTANALVDFVSFVGFAAYQAFHKEGGIVQIGIHKVRQFLKQEEVPTIRDSVRRQGAAAGPFYVNRRSGRPGWEPHHQTRDTGGKDQYCLDNRAPIIIDDNAGIAASCAFIGVTPLLVCSPKKAHRRAGVTAFSGLPAALQHAYRLLTAPDSRRRLIWEAQNLRQPHGNARVRFDFGDAANAPGNITAADFSPKWEEGQGPAICR